MSNLVLFNAVKQSIKDYQDAVPEEEFDAISWDWFSSWFTYSVLVNDLVSFTLNSM